MKKEKSQTKTPQELLKTFLCTSPGHQQTKYFSKFLWVYSNRSMTFLEGVETAGTADWS